MLRTYHRPFRGEHHPREWEQVLDRVVSISDGYGSGASRELMRVRIMNWMSYASCLRALYLPAGRTLWLGGTELSRKRDRVCSTAPSHTWRPFTMSSTVSGYCFKGVVLASTRLLVR